MKPDRCSFCKGKLARGKTEFVVKVDDEILKALHEYEIRHLLDG